MEASLAIFVYYNGTFYGKSSELRGTGAISTGSYMQVNCNVASTWEECLKEIGIKNSDSEYKNVIKGIIVFHILTHHFIVLSSDEGILDENIQKAIVEFYHLPVSAEFRYERSLDEWR